MIIKRIYWRLLRAVGLDKLSWDKQYKAGIWCRGPRSVHVLNKVVELCKGGILIEFGAGEGTLPIALPNDAFSKYIGYDISSVAIERARKKVSKAGKNNCQFKQCDMSGWKGTSGVSLILIEECLNYLSTKCAEKFLLTCSQSLLRNGYILVVLHSAIKHSRTVEVCKRVCTVKEEIFVRNRIYLTLTQKLHKF